jgi:hypothetical protein
MPSDRCRADVGDSYVTVTVTCDRDSEVERRRAKDAEPTVGEGHVTVTVTRDRDGEDERRRAKDAEPTLVKVT